MIRGLLLPCAICGALAESLTSASAIGMRLLRNVLTTVWIPLCIVRLVCSAPVKVLRDSLPMMGRQASAVRAGWKYTLVEFGRVCVSEWYGGG